MVTEFFPMCLGEPNPKSQPSPGQMRVTVAEY